MWRSRLPHYLFFPQDSGEVCILNEQQNEGTGVCCVICRILSRGGKGCQDDERVLSLKNWRESINVF